MYPLQHFACAIFDIVITHHILGDYFIAELIEAQDDTHRTIVADVSVMLTPVS